MTRFTPGPWSLDKHTNCDIVAANGRLEIATTHEAILTGGFRDPSTAQADALLIAAAPELLEALKGMMKLRAPDLLTNCERAEIINAAIDAICKATGEEPQS